MPPAPVSTRFRRNVALVLGVNAYGEGIPALDTAVDDAQELARVLAADHQFEVELRVDDGATTTSLRGLLTKAATELTANDRLLLFAACHGVSRRGDGVRPDGFLLLHDAVAGDPNSYLPMRQLYRAIGVLPCRHVLVVLDCCFAGMFASQREFGDPLPVFVERYDQFVDSAAWQVLASAARDQRALDQVVDREAARGGHSPFAGALLDALAGQADLDANGLVTATELYWYIRGRVERREHAAWMRQTPNLAPLDKHEHGEFVFQVADQLQLQPAPVLTAELNPYRGLTAFSEASAAMFFGREAAIAELLAKVLAQRLTVITGPASSGKSSLVLAGLVPAVRNRAGWSIACLDARTDDVARCPAPTAEGRRLVIIDHVERAADLRALEHAVGDRLDREPGTHVLLVARVDVEHTLQAGPLASRWTGGHMRLPPPSRAELREMIVRPARELVMVFEPDELVELLLDEVIVLPAPLPILSHALAALYGAYWRRQTQLADPADRALRAAGRPTLQDIVGELARAEAVAWTAEERVVARNFVPRLFQRDAGGVQRPRRQALVQLGFGVAAWDRTGKRVIERLVAARLAVIDTDERGAYVGPLHAEMLSVLPPRPGDPELLEALEEATAAWELAGRPRRSNLWDDDAHRLQRLEVLAAAPAVLVIGERAFVRASRRAYARRWARNAAVALLAVAALVGGIIAYAAQRRDRRAAAFASAAARAAEQYGNAKNELSKGEYEQARAYAEEAVTLAPDGDPLSPSYGRFAAWLTAQAPDAFGQLPGPVSIGFADLSADGTRLAASDAARVPRIWVGGPDWREVPLRRPDPWAVLQGPSWSPDGSLVVATMGDATDRGPRARALIVWDAEGAEVARYAVPQDSQRSYVPRDITFCGDGCVAFVVTCTMSCDGAWQDAIVLDVRRSRQDRVLHVGNDERIDVGPSAFTVAREAAGVWLVPLTARDVTLEQLPTSAFPHLEGPAALGVSADGEHVYVVTGSGEEPRLERWAAGATGPADPASDAVALGAWMGAAARDGFTVEVSPAPARGSELVTVSAMSGRTAVYEATDDRIRQVTTFEGRIEVLAAGELIVVRDLGGKRPIIRSFAWTDDDEEPWYAISLERALPLGQWVGGGLDADGVVGVTADGWIERVSTGSGPARSWQLPLEVEPTHVQFVDDESLLVIGRVLDEGTPGSMSWATAAVFDGTVPRWRDQIRSEDRMIVEDFAGLDVDRGMWWHMAPASPLALLLARPPACTCSGDTPLVDDQRAPGLLVLRDLRDGERLGVAQWPRDGIGGKPVVAVVDRQFCYPYRGDAGERDLLRCVDLATGGCAATITLPTDAQFLGLSPDGGFALYGLYDQGIGVLGLADQRWRELRTSFRSRGVLAAAVGAASSVTIEEALGAPDRLRSMTLELAEARVYVTEDYAALQVGGGDLLLDLDGIAARGPVLAFSADGRLVAIADTPPALGSWRGRRVGRELVLVDVVLAQPVMRIPFVEWPLAARFTDEAVVTVSHDGVVEEWPLP